MNLEFHEIANIFPMMTGQEYAALRDDIAQNGQREPITIWQNKIIDGRNRYNACIDLGLEPTLREWDGCGDLVKYVLSLNLHRRHLDEAQRAMVAGRVENIAHGGDRKSQDANLHLDQITRQNAADLLSVSPRSVASAKAVLGNGIPELIELVDRGEMAVSAAERIARFEPEAQRESIKAPHVSHNSGNNEWYTPPEYIAAAREVVGEIDLDPASSEIANSVIKARRFYSIDDDGLSKKWRGRVWMNPPYAAGLIDQFTSKLCKHVAAGDITEAIVLVNNATEAAWFEEMADTAETVMFTFSRVKFLDSDLNPRGTPLQGQAILYFGPNYKKFIKAFSSLAWAVNRGKH